MLLKDSLQLLSDLTPTLVSFRQRDQHLATTRQCAFSGGSREQGALENQDEFVDAGLAVGLASPSFYRQALVTRDW